MPLSCKDRKAILFALTLAATALATPKPAHGAEPVTLVKEGKAVATLYVSGELFDEPFKVPTLRTIARDVDREKLARSVAVADLNYHLKVMSGATLPVVITDDPAQVKQPAVVIGQLATRMGAKPNAVSPSLETFRLIAGDGLLLVGGESDIAARHGVYSLLRKLGCEWVMPGKIGEVLPERKTIAIEPMDLSDTPDFEFRSLWYRGYPNRTDAEFQRFYQWMWRQQGRERFGHPLFGAAGHMWDALIRRNQAVFDANPEMLALVRKGDGTLVREGPQLESVDPRVVDLFVEHIQNAYEANIAAGKWTTDTAAGFSVGPADGMGYSVSAEALAASAGRIDPVVGELDRTDECVLLANRVLERVTKQYPNAHVGYYTYSTHADYPLRYKPHPNLIQILAPINYSRYHSLLDPNSKTQAIYRDILQPWFDLSAEQGNVIWYRGYNWNLAENFLPYTKVRIWGEELPWYHEHGVIGMDVEATKQWATLAASDYVFMRLAWDTDQDWRDLLRDFCNAAYGPAAEPMLAYHLRLIDQQHGAGQEAGSYHALHLIYDDAFITAARADFKQARSLAATEEQHQRIQHSAWSIDALELYLAYHAATLAFDFELAAERLQALYDHWNEVYAVNPDLVASEAPQYFNRFLKRFVEQAKRYSTGENRVVARLPDELKTMFDPNDAGHRMNFFEPSLNDDGYLRTKTYSTTWDAQGLVGLRDGAVWYRFAFDLPDDTAGQPLGLFIGSVEDLAEVWLNGEHCGVSGRGFSFPFTFDLTDAAKPGENLLAIRVERRGKANEIGLGGIIRPSFIFTGERVESPDGRERLRGRILPGGSVEKPRN